MNTTKDLYSYIGKWKDEKYYSDFSTLVDMTYALEERCSNSDIKFNIPVDEMVRTYFRGLELAQKDASEGYCPGTSVPETTKTILSTLIHYERYLNYKLKN